MLLCEICLDSSTVWRIKVLHNNAKKCENFKTGVGNLFTIRGRMNRGSPLAGRK